MFSIVLVLVLTKLPIVWKQVVFEHFTGVLELRSRGGIYATAGKNCARLVCYSFNVGLGFFSCDTKDVKLAETCMYSLMHQ